MESKDIRELNKLYMEAVYGGGKKVEKKDTRLTVTNADKKANTPAWQKYKAGSTAYKAADHVKEGKDESPEEEEEKDKEDDDLAGSPNKKGKKKAKRWWDDDGDGKGYEKGEVDGKFPDKDGSKKKKKDVKEGYAKPNTTVPKGSKVGPKKVAAPKGSKVGPIATELKDLAKGTETLKGKNIVKADKLLNKEDIDSIMKVIYEKQKDTPDQVAAVIDMYRSKKGTGEAVKDTEEGKKKDAKKERDYAAWEREKMKKDDPDWKHKKGSTTESVDADYIEIVREIKSAETQADLKRWGALEESGNFSDKELAIIIEADIADILARLEKKRISKGGDPEESPLPAMRKYHADKKKKKVKEEVEIDEGIVRAIKKAKRIGKRILDAHDSDPGRAHTIGTLGNPSVANDEKRAAERKAGKKKVKEEIELDEAERSLADRLARKRKVYDKTLKKAMQFARDEGEASGHARYRMGSIDREMDGIKAKMNKEK